MQDQKKPLEPYGRAAVQSPTVQMRNFTDLPKIALMLTTMAAVSKFNMDKAR